LWWVMSFEGEPKMKLVQEMPASTAEPLFEDWEKYFAIGRDDALSDRRAEIALSDFFMVTMKKDLLPVGRLGDIPTFTPGLTERRLFRVSRKEAASYYAEIEQPEKWGVMLPGGWKVGFEPVGKLKDVAGNLWQNPTLDALRENAPGALKGAMESLQFELKFRF